MLYTKCAIQIKVSVSYLSVTISYKSIFLHQRFLVKQTNYKLSCQRIAKKITVKVELHSRKESTHSKKRWKKCNWAYKELAEIFDLTVDSQKNWLTLNPFHFTPCFFSLWSHSQENLLTAWSWIFLEFVIPHAPNSWWFSAGNIGSQLDVHPCAASAVCRKCRRLHDAKSTPLKWLFCLLHVETGRYVPDCSFCDKINMACVWTYPQNQLAGDSPTERSLTRHKCRSVCYYFYPVTHSLIFLTSNWAPNIISARNLEQILQTFLFSNYTDAPEHLCWNALGKMFISSLCATERLV